MTLAVVAGVLLFSVAAWRSWEVRRHRRDMEQARAEMQAGRYGHAARTLLSLAAGGPGWDEAAYLLGVCEKARGRGPAAADAWARVPPGSPFAEQAIQGLMDLQLQSGRLGDAERLIERAVADPRLDGSVLCVFLWLVYSLEGRDEDGERLIESNWRRLDAAGLGASEQAIQLARLHVAIRQEGSSTSAMRAYLDKAARSAPNDDRVWLGRARLAIRGGAYDEAASWLDACQAHRPEDAAVWRARLDCALASGRVDQALVAMAHLPAAGAKVAEVRRLAAWLAARRGNAGAERRALERLIAADPADRAALVRLAAVCREQGDPVRAAELERRTAELERLQARFQELYRRNQPTRDAAELARIAEQLGRPFQARAFLTLAVAADPDRAELRGPRPGHTMGSRAKHGRHGARSYPGPDARARNWSRRPARTHERPRKNQFKITSSRFRMDVKSRVPSI